ncbi:MAG: hypothetical protein JW751_07065 [Polyangiaceae bacterium]|nr:hypothetical protein [Polyangiaceae bacterium]
MSYTEVFLDEARRIAALIARATIDRLVDGLVAVREREGRVFVLGVGDGAGNAGHSDAARALRAGRARRGALRPPRRGHPDEFRALEGDGWNAVPPEGSDAGGTAADMRTRLAAYATAPFAWPEGSLCASDDPGTAGAGSEGNGGGTAGGGSDAGGEHGADGGKGTGGGGPDGTGASEAGGGEADLADDDEDSDDGGGCGCRTVATGRGPTFSWLAPLAALALYRQRR